MADIRTGFVILILILVVAACWTIGGIVDGLVQAARIDCNAEAH